MRYAFIKDNLHFFQIYKIRSIFILFLFLMCIDINYESLISLLIPIFVCFLYCADCYTEYKKTRFYLVASKYFKYFKVVLSLIFSSYINVLTMNEMVYVTGFSYNNFSLSFYVLFIATIIILLLPLSLLFILFISVVYELKLFGLNIISLSKRNFIKIVHYFIMFLMPIFFSMKIYEQTKDLVVMEMSKLFKYVLVYTSYTDIPERCLNKNILERKYGDIKVAFLDHERMSIVYSRNKDFFFSSDVCK